MSFDPTDSVFKDWLRDMLQVTNVEVTFTKTDGTERVMNCTLQPDIAIPYEKKTNRHKPINTEVLAVWDIDKGEWRSFNYASIKKVQLTIC